VDKKDWENHAPNLKKIARPWTEPDFWSKIGSVFPDLQRLPLIWSPNGSHGEGGDTVSPPLLLIEMGPLLVCRTQWPRG